ncbi:hypothetical protein KKP91_01545 [Methanothermococcus sp. SCGC AD-155-M21]|nr:hypothetical protein [Methanothermococcus sp. SCGC AD-155-M21]
MNRILILLISILILPAVGGAHFGDSEIIYNYYQGLIDEGHDSLYNLSNNKKGELISTNVFNVTKDLKEYNISHELLEITPPFEDLHYALNNIIVNYNSMIEHSNVENPRDYLIFDNSLKNVLNNITLLKNSLNKIDNLSLYDSKGHLLKFDTSKIREDIDKLSGNTERYSEKLENIKTKGFYIYSNSNTAYINSKVVIYGKLVSNHNIESIVLFHNNKHHIIKLKENSFSKDIYIDTLGKHTFYAISPVGKSNKLIIKSLKIPTYIETYPDGYTYNNIEAYIGEEVNLKIHLYDHYGKELKNSTLYINYPDKNHPMEYKTPTNLSIKVPNNDNHNWDNNTLKISVFYKGNNTYNNSKKVINIRVLRIPTYIVANYSNNTIMGKIFDYKNRPLDNKTIYLNLNNETYSTVSKNGIFKFKLPEGNFNSGYIIFKGDYKYAPSSKEILMNNNLLLTINKNPAENPILIPILLIFMVMIVFILFKRKYYQRDNLNSPKIEERKENMDNIRNRIINLINDSKIFLEFKKLINNKMFKEAIIGTYYLFIKTLNIKGSHTPREICQMYKDVAGIKTITRIFEKVYYGNISPDKKDVEEYKKFFKGD